MKRRLLSLFPILLITIAFVGCTKYYNPAPEFEEYEQEVELSVKRKVMLISIDGLVGKELEKKVPANISQLMKSGKYSFDALADVNTSDASAWATMMTGYNSAKHHITDENYIPQPNSDDPHGEVLFAPSVLYRLKQVEGALRTAVVVQDEGLGNILLMDADENIIADSDEKAKDESVKILERAQIPDFLVIQFKDILKAGKESGFSASEEGYANAIEKVDGYIGNILKAIDARESKDYEDWLIILTSTHGGVDKSYGGDSYAERNIFTLYHQKDFKPMEFFPEIIVSPHFYGFDGTENGPAEGVRARNLTQANGEDNYNLAKTGQLTIEAKVKINKNAAGNYSYSWPPFLSKVSARSGTNAGWSFFRNGNNVSLYCADGASKIEIVGGPVSVDDQWAHMTGVLSSENGVVTAKLYVNGSKVSEGEAKLNLNNVVSTSPLTFGFQGSVFSTAFLDLNLADIHIWNTVLSDDEIRENSRRMGVAEDHQKIQNLIGNWPMDDGGAVLKNKIAGMPDIPLQGDYQYIIESNNLPFVDPDAILMQNVDIASHVFYWLGLKPHEAWALQGKTFLSNYELEFLK